jgi:hypothetical protein
VERVIDFTKGYSFSEYLEKGYEEERDRQRRACSRAVFSPAFEEAARHVNKPLKLAAFAEIYCPDSVVTMTFVHRMAELNPKIELAVFPRSPFEKELEALTGSSRIPTLLFFDEEMNLSGSYVELPKALKEEMRDLDAGEKSALTLDYRRGKYNEVLQAELTEILSLFAS